MSEMVELSTLDLRYEGHRLRDNSREARLLASIAERGIEEPLEGVGTSEASRFLLNGFKRYRCAKKLGLGCVPYVSLGEDEATSILNLMRVSKEKALGMLEQARFVADLVSVHGMSVAAFCRSEGVSEASFYAWKRRLKKDARPASRSRRPATPKAARTTQQSRSQAAGEPAPVAAGFVPVRISDEPRPAMFQVRWPGGLLVRIPTACDRADVEVVLTAVDRLVRQQREGKPR